MSDKRSLAFAIVNDLLNDGCIAEDVRATDAQLVVQARLNMDPRFRERIVHLQDIEDLKRFKERVPHCHHPGKVILTDMPHGVTCLNCLGMYDVQRAKR